jgi:F-type H+-transporting ATPase subunit delta
MSANSVSARLDAYARAILEIAIAEGYLAESEDELFRFARAFEASDELRMALSDPALPADRRMAVVEQLLPGASLATSRAVASFIVGIGRGHDLPAIVDRFIALAAESRSHEVAEVRSAVALTDTQVADLAAALSRATGKRVEVKVVVDEKVLGGIVARVGDTVIDGSVRYRLDQLRATV